MDDKEALKKEEVYATIEQRLQGSEEFIDRVLNEYEGEIKKERRRKEYTLSAPVKGGRLPMCDIFCFRETSRSSFIKMVELERSNFSGSPI